MFDIGFWEIAFIGILALVVLGPKRLPEAARFAGQWVGRIRRFIASAKQDLDNQLQSDELAELRRLKEELVQTHQTIADTSRKLTDDISSGLADAEWNVRNDDHFTKAIDESASTSRARPKATKKKSTGKKTAKKKSAKKTTKRSSKKKSANKAVRRKTAAKKKS
ncbi:MAG: hypothetical protein BMS9Abin36_0282 [Gammaproteobacteria bacterium]|nr:MAG: hypothetical protein BMS9Abin36_0282 [Gammaproteobacteria bacterium]